MFGPFTSYVGLQLAEAGRNLDSVEVLGETASMASFSMVGISECSSSQMKRQ